MQTRTHAAAAFANVQDMTLVKSVGCDNLVQSLEQASAVLQARSYCHYSLSFSLHMLVEDCMFDYMQLVCLKQKS